MRPISAADNLVSLKSPALRHEREHFKLALIQTSLCDSREQWCVQILILEQRTTLKRVELFWGRAHPERVVMVPLLTHA